MKGKGIPPVGTLAYVLLNFYLDQIDRELQRVLPEGAKSYRYVSDILVAIPTDDRDIDRKVAEKIIFLLIKLD